MALPRLLTLNRIIHEDLPATAYSAASSFDLLESRSTASSSVPGRKHLGTMEGENRIEIEVKGSKTPFT